MDFETYSEAGYVFDEATNKWLSIVSSPPHGLGAVGAAVYSEHPSTEVLCLAYDLKTSRGAHLWAPGRPLPVDLFAHIAVGGLIEAFNSGFEYLIWKNVCNARMGWPVLPLEQLRCAMAKARAHALPGALGNAAKVLGTEDQKMTEGRRLITKFCKPRNPTKKNPARRIRPEDDPEDAAKLYAYCLGDIKAEAAVSALTPDLNPVELTLWKQDQRINDKGVGVDVRSLRDCQKIVSQATARAVSELPGLTGGAVMAPTQLPSIKTWIAARGVQTDTLDADAVAGLLSGDLPPDVRRVLEIRASLGAASVLKLKAMARRMSGDGRLRGLFMYHGAERTGRWAGRGVQPQNLPNSGPAVSRCRCGRHHARKWIVCPWCGSAGTSAPVEWGLEAVEDVLHVTSSGNVDCVEYYFGDPVAAVSGCIRGLLCAAPGHELISSDYSAIEAVVLAYLAGEEWRLEVFRTHGMIYEMSAAKITGVPFDDFVKHKAETGEHHPMRKKVGKVAELASGYQGSVGAWRAFGADKHIGDDAKILAAVRRWREASPMIVKFWYGLRDAATDAIKNPGHCFSYRDITYGVSGDVLYCRLPSGRLLSYHTPRLIPGADRYGRPVEKITFMGWNTDHTKGPKGWIRFDTYGGKLAENVTQATARDILAHAMPQLEAAGYPIVIHVHDEPVSEVLTGFGSIEEYEDIMCRLPDWAKDYPIRAGGGWRGRRYRKD